MEIILIELIREIFRCIQDRNEPEVEEDLNDPGRRVYRGILRTLRRTEDLHGKELFAEADEVFGALTEMDAEDVSVLIEKATMAPAKEED